MEVQDTEVVITVESKCKYDKYSCSLAPEPNQQLCNRHILSQPSTSYRPCDFLYPNGLQCGQAKLSEETDNSSSTTSTYCFEHSRLAQLNKTKTTVGTFKNIESTEVLSHNLGHYVKIDKLKPQITTTNVSPFDEEIVDVGAPSVTVDPFTDINALDINSRLKYILDYASDSSTDEETLTTLKNTWKSYENEDSDDESVDSSNEDLLKHAGVFTVDEVVSISREKMVHLQNLYIDQFQRLQHVLREKRRQYLIELKKEKEVLSSVHEQIKDSPSERNLYKNLKALHRYNRRYGNEALLYRQFLDKRQRQTELAAVPPLQQQKNIPKCTFSEGGVKCNEKSIPCCKFCRKHISEDRKQILFKACGIEKSGIVCQENVVNIFEDSACVLHTPLPTPKTYVKRKYESETEDEDDTTAFKKEFNTITSDIITTSVSEMKVEPTSTDTYADEVIVE